MTAQITLSLPEETYQRALRVAELTQRDVAEILALTIDISLPTFEESTLSQPPVRALTDAALLAATELQMEPAKDRRYSELLEKQQTETLDPSENAELAALFLVYQEGLLRKAQALAEAVRRGLRGPLEP